jgi:hypothetical protein
MKESTTREDNEQSLKKEIWVKKLRALLLSSVMADFYVWKKRYVEEVMNAQFEKYRVDKTENLFQEWSEHVEEQKTADFPKKRRIHCVSIGQRIKRKRRSGFFSHPFFEGKKTPLLIILKKKERNKKLPTFVFSLWT